MCFPQDRPQKYSCAYKNTTRITQNFVFYICLFCDILSWGVKHISNHMEAVIMFFDKDKYSDEAAEINGEKIFYRAYRNIVFVEKPADDFFHRMNIYVPLAYYRGESINGYSLKTAPVFMPNDVGGYKPAGIEEPSESETIKQALLKGYVVVSPAVRGRDLKDSKGGNYGKAPACIVDYKAAVRYLRFF